jgi:uncharacterized protein
MSEWLESQQRQADAIGVQATGAKEATVDAGLRSHMMMVYNYMVSGLLLTGIVSILFSKTEFAQNLYTNPSALTWVIGLSPLVLLLLMGAGFNRMSKTTMLGLFFLLATLIGLSFSSLAFQYTGESIARTFFITAIAFSSLSFWGYTTKKDLSGFGTFLLMGLVGLFVAMIANYFMQSSTLQLVISAAGVLIFAGFTAYDNQKIKSEYYHLAGTEALGKAAVWGALNLYLDFVNLFQFLLSFLGSRE